MIIITILPDTPQVEHVLFSLRGVAAGLTPGKLVIDMSSISPAATKGFARRIGDRGCVPLAGGLEGLGREVRRHGVHRVSYSAAIAVGAAWAPRSRRPGRASVGVPSR